MLTKTILPEREKVGKEKTTEISKDGTMRVVDGPDFFRVAPNEIILDFEDSKYAS